MIVVGFVTYPIHPKRLEYFEGALTAAEQYLTASRHELRYVCSCESDPRGDVPAALALCQRFGVPMYLNDGPPSMGANQNNLDRIVLGEQGAPYLLLHLDDCFATAPIDFSDDLDFLDAHSEIDLLRYHWSGRPGALPTFVDRGDGYNQVDPSSYRFYDDSPHIRRGGHLDKFGPQMTGTPAEAGRIERDTCRRLRDAKANIVAAPTLRFAKGGGEVSACRGILT